MLRQQLPGRLTPARPRFPAGRGVVFASDMASMIAQAKHADPGHVQRRRLDQASRRNHALGGRAPPGASSQAVAKQARQKGFSLQGQPGGFFLVPLDPQGEPMDDQAFAALEAAARDELMQRRDTLMDELREVMKRRAERRGRGQRPAGRPAHSVADVGCRPPMMDRLPSEFARPARRSSQLSRTKCGRTWSSTSTTSSAPRAAGAARRPVPRPARAALSPLRALRGQPAGRLHPGRVLARGLRDATRRRSACSAGSRRKRSSAP